MIKYKLDILCKCILIIIFGNNILFAQGGIGRVPRVDSLQLQMKLDSINKEKNKLIVPKSNSGLDTIVSYQADDTINFYVKPQLMRLRGNSKVSFKSQKLEAEIIEISFKNSLLNAEGVVDSNKKMIGVPKFEDKGEQFYGEKISFNFKTNKGAINLGETKMGEGFYFAEKMKKTSAIEMYGQNGYYTTCDAPHPHFHFGSPHMKVIAQDRVFLDPLILYVEDLPVFIFPFGLFFPSKGGRQSGLMVPTFSFSSNRGVVFQDLGFYWAASDYFDAQIKTDFYSKGGIMLETQFRYNLIDNFNGSLGIDYGRTRSNVDEDYKTNFRLNFIHNQNLGPDENFVANLNLLSSNFNRNTLTNIRDYQQQNITSNVSYSKSFDNRSNVAVSYQRNQNIITDEINQSIPLTYTFPSTKLFSAIESAPRWVKDIQFNYSFNASYSDSKTKSIMEKIKGDTASSNFDTVFVKSNRSLIQHSPSISISPKLGFFTISPSVSFGANNYFRKLTKKFNLSDSTIKADTIDGFFTEYRYSASLSLSTNIYGIADDKQPLFFFIKPSSLGFKAFRHSYSPSIALSITPDQSDPSMGFYGNYTDEKNNKVVYSKFELDGGGIASRYRSQQISYYDRHSFEIKVAQGDTLPDKNIELLRLEFGTGYNFVADSLKLSDISLRFRTPALTFIEFSGGASFTPYDENIIQTTENNVVKTEYRKVNEFLLQNGKGLARITNFTMNLSTSFNSQGISLNPNGTDLHRKTNDSMNLGERFSRRRETSSNDLDLYGEFAPGYYPSDMPWNINLNLMYNYNRISNDPKSKSETLNLQFSGNIKLTPSWSLDISGNYDFINSKLGVPSLNFTKDMHCWDFAFSWIPSGGAAGFFLRFGIKASQLKDLKIEKQDNPLLR